MTVGHGEKQSRKQEQAIAALLTQPTLAKAAAKARISLNTLKAWLQERDFQEAYRKARGEVLRRTLGRLCQASSKATSTLVKALRIGDVSQQIKAAAIILDRATKGMEVVDLAERIESLERNAETNQ